MIRSLRVFAHGSISWSPFRASDVIMHSPHVQPKTSSHAIRLWLLTVAALMCATLLVGGATRLTESGLSIVEWKPVTGVVPPLDAAQWQAEFDKYKTIPQFRERNAAMGLAEFKTIYWWEWAHRALARFVGAAFLVPFLWFLWRGEVDRALRVRLWTIFALGGALGAVGWWMVSSGLSERVSVSQYRLAFHLALACAILAMVLWTAQRLIPRERIMAPARIRGGAVALLMLVLAQIYLGALVAGLRAGLMYNTWPLIDGRFVPDAAALWFAAPWWRNLFENALTVQFDHRMLAYAIVALTLIHLADVARLGRGPALTGAFALAAAVTLQAALGVVTLVQQAPLALALLHQAMAIVVLTIAVLHAERLTAAKIAASPSGLMSFPR
jgi:cytochrome c oxidase assembly protein subunit 15